MGITPKIHFLYDPQKPGISDFANQLCAHFGQTPAQEADTIVSIGGDGALLQALRKGAGKRVCGLIPPSSNSRGFWTNRGIETPEALADMLATSPAYFIKPLKAGITFADGTSAERYGYNDISISSVHQNPTPEMREQFDLDDIDVCVQSALISLRVLFTNATLGPVRVMGGGLAFVTPFGSTAMNANYGGPSIDIRSDAIILTGLGTGEPVKGFNPVVNAGDVIFQAGIESANKRPVKMTFDSFGVVGNDKGEPITRMTVSLAPDRAAHLVLNTDPGTRAYAAMQPG